MQSIPKRRSNEEWLEALRSSDDAGGIVVQELSAYLRRALAKVLRGRGDVREGDLDDLTQQALLEIVQNLDRFRGDAAFTTWATAVATRVSFTQLRRRAVRERGRTAFDEAREDALASDAPRAPSAEDEVAGAQLLQSLETAIARDLTDRQRTAILAELRGVPTIEIAERMGTNQNALYKLVHDARKKLHASLVAAGYDADAIHAHVSGEASA